MGESSQVTLRGASVLIVGGDTGFRSRLRGARAPRGLVDSADGAAKAGQLMSRCHFEFLVVDAALPDAPALDWVAGCSSDGIAPVVVLAAERLDRKLLIDAMRRGVSDVLERPFETEALVESLQRAAAMHDRRPAMRRPACPRA
jgi:DNA-binding NtrC family response regulator